MTKVATVIVHRQVIRLCKGIIKAWEQWVDEMVREAQATPPRLNAVAQIHPAEKSLNGSNKENPI